MDANWWKIGREASAASAAATAPWSSVRALACAYMRAQQAQLAQQPCADARLLLQPVLQTAPVPSPSLLRPAKTTPFSSGRPSCCETGRPRHKKGTRAVHTAVGVVGPSNSQGMGRWDQAGAKTNSTTRAQSPEDRSRDSAPWNAGSRKGRPRVGGQR